MKFHKLPIDGACLVEPERRGDERGWFARVFCGNEMSAAGLADRFVQVNDSFSAAAGTLRGMHYQLPSAAEAKLVRCIRGSLWDAIVDLRPDSPTYLRWHGVELNADERLALYVPRGCAHGFVTLEPETEVFYLASAFYTPEAERGLRWNDPRIGIAWPAEAKVVSEKDANWPDFDEDWHGVERLRGLRVREQGAAHGR